MSNSKWRLRGGVAIAAAVALGLSGCAVGGGGDASDDKQSDGAAAAIEDGEITGEISFQTWNLKANFQDYFDGVISDFEE